MPIVKLKKKSILYGLRDKFLLKLQGDFFGALSAAIITLPMSIGYGIIAFAPLGTEFAPKAAIIGVYSAVFGGIMAGIFGGTPIQITGPKAPLTLVLGTFVAGMTAKLALSIPSSLLPEIIIGLAAVCVSIAGLCQVILGSLGAGNLVKYVPQPVVAGFMNGIAFLLIVKQIRPILGLEGSTSLTNIFQHPSLVNPFTTVVGIVTIATIFLARRYITRIPAPLIALGVGSALFYILESFVGTKAMGDVIGRIDVGLPASDTVFRWSNAIEQLSSRVLLQELLSTGFIIGMLASMESLFASVVSDNLTGSRHDSKKELIGQGLGNISCGLFGVLPVAGSIPRSMANYRNGGRTCISGILCSIIILLMIVFLSPVVGKIPLAVIAGIIFVVGVMLFDRWSLNLLKRLIKSFKYRKEALVDLIITLVVAIVTVSINLIATVGVGMLIASAMFIARMGRSIIKRIYLGSQFHSRKMHSREHTETLEKMGDQIVVIELQGPLFFGSAENLAIEIENMMPKTEYCILNFKRVNDIDSTGAYIVSQIKKKLEDRKVYLLISYVKENQALWNFMDVICGDELLESCFIFHDTDSALEWAEDHLLEKINRGVQKDENTDLERMELFKGFSKEELRVVQTRAVFHNFRKGQLVFNEGDVSRDLYLLTKGSMSVKTNLPERNEQKRVLTFTSGIPFGEMAFLDGNQRSASVWAEEDSEVLRLEFEQFQILCGEHPEIATKLIANLSLELSRRLRTTSNQLRALQDS